MSQCKLAAGGSCSVGREGDGRRNEVIIEVSLSLDCIFSASAITIRNFNNCLQDTQLKGKRKVISARQTLSAVLLM